MTITKKTYITVISLVLSIAVGTAVGLFYVNANANDSNSHAGIHSDGFEVQTSNLEEELWHVDAIVQGTVLQEEATYQQKAAGLKEKKEYSFDVTPASIKVSDVLYGDVSSDTITFLQHGASNESKASATHLKQGEDVILLLVKTSWGDYWAYEPDNGVWKVKDGKVDSNAAQEQFVQLKNTDVDSFKQIIADAAKNKKKSSQLK
ncbi:MAG: hypothetical protein WDZ91_02580 [Paenibacillaceae bacterium]